MTNKTIWSEQTEILLKNVLQFSTVYNLHNCLRVVYAEFQRLKSYLMNWYNIPKSRGRTIIPDNWLIKTLKGCNFRKQGSSIVAISRIRFRIQHFRTHLVTCHSWKPWQHSRRREARLLPRGVDEHKRKIPKKTKEFNSIKSI